MRMLSLAAYWTAALAGSVLWSAAIVTLTSLPLPSQLALASMALVASFWGQAVLFPKPRDVSAPVAPGRWGADQEPAFAMAPRAVAASRPAQPRRRDALIGRPPAPAAASTPADAASPKAEPPAVRKEALSKALAAAGAFGPGTLMTGRPAAHRPASPPPGPPVWAPPVWAPPVWASALERLARTA